MPLKQAFCLACWPATEEFRLAEKLSFCKISLSFRAKSLSFYAKSLSFLQIVEFQWERLEFWMITHQIKFLTRFLQSSYKDIHMFYVLFLRLFLCKTKKLSSGFAKTQFPKIGKNSVFGQKLRSKVAKFKFFRIFFTQNHEKMHEKPPNFRKLSSKNPKT